MLAPNTTLLESRPIALSAMRCSDGNGTLSYLFFSEEFVDIARAKAICAKCTTSEACLSGALEREEPWGVWGGELLENGRIVANKRPRGRPAIRVRHVTPIDEVPIPLHLVASVA
jgi:WhiB family redox-sensing transcriptional regulator